jgi:group I intron endonuclease
MSSIYSIYKATNTINGKVYIGFDSNWPNRKRYHKSQHKKTESKFYNAICKYGWDKFDWEVLYQSKDGNHTLKNMETYFIEQFNSFSNGYNSTLGGDGILGFKHNKEQIQKRTNKVKGRKHSIEWCENISKGKKGKPRLYMIKNNPMHNPEIVKKLMAKRQGRNHPLAKSITINGITYGCKKDAMNQTGLSKYHLNKLLTTNLS